MYLFARFGKKFVMALMCKLYLGFPYSSCFLASLEVEIAIDFGLEAHLLESTNTGQDLEFILIGRKFICWVV